MKEHYKRGGLGDGVCKKFLISVLEEELSPIRAEREKWQNNIGDVYDILADGINKARKKTDAVLSRVQKSMRIDYFDDRSIIGEWEELLKQPLN